MTHDWSRNAALRSALQAALPENGIAVDHRLDVVCTHNEVNDQHGTGLLVARLFQRPGPPVLSIRAHSDWGAIQEFGIERLEMPGGGRQQIYEWVLNQLGGRAVRHVHCIPFGEPEIYAALAVRDACDVPLCLYIMDDQNVVGNMISDELMAEAIDKATIRLAISSDMQDAYEAKYNRKFWLAPPTIPDGVVPQASTGPPGHLVLVGNIWAREWLHAFGEAIRASGVSVDWFCNIPGGPQWIDRASIRELEEAGVALRDPLPFAELVERLPSYEAAIMPTVGATEVRQGVPVAMLSLPSRVALLVGAGDLPIIIMGHADTCAARFVEHFGIGTSCPYQAEELLRALRRTRDPAWRNRQRARLTHLRQILGGTDIAAWLQTSLTHGTVINREFESLTVDPPRYVRRYIAEPERPLGAWMHTYDEVRTALSRVAAQGYKPDFIIDGGASTGVWSYAASLVFPKARFVLVEPLLSEHSGRANGTHFGRLERPELFECALAEADGEGEMEIGDSLYQAQLDRHPGEHDGSTNSHRQLVPVRSLDSLAQEMSLGGSGMLKLDLQGSELGALRGGEQLVRDQIDAVVVEVTLDPGDSDDPGFAEVDSYLRDAGFTLLDELGSWRDPATGVLLEKELLYIRREHPIAMARRAAGVR